MHELRPSKHANYIHGFPNILKPGERSLSQGSVDVRVHGQYFVSELLQISSHAVARPPGLIGQPDDGDCSGLA